MSMTKTLRGDIPTALVRYLRADPERAFLPTNHALCLVGRWLNAYHKGTWYVMRDGVYVLSCAGARYVRHPAWMRAIVPAFDARFVCGDVTAAAVLAWLGLPLAEPPRRTRTRRRALAEVGA